MDLTGQEEGKDLEGIIDVLVGAVKTQHGSAAHLLVWGGRHKSYIGYTNLFKTGVARFW